VLPRKAASDSGGALITVVLLMAVLSGLGATLAVLTTNNLESASRDRQAISALSTADAGVAQALEYIRLNGVGRLTCLEANRSTTVATDPCRSNPAGWANPNSPQQVNVDGGTCGAGSTCYRVSITALRRYDPPTVRTGLYRITSTGVAGTAPGARSVAVDVEVTPATLPIGVFGKELDGNGGTQLFDISLFTTDCVSPRFNGNGNGTRFTGGLDPYWDEPAAANSTSFISTGVNCTPSGAIHGSGPCPTSSELYYDRDSQGGAVASTSPCATFLNAAGQTVTRTRTSFTPEDLASYGYRPGGLTGQQYDALRARADAMNLLNVTPANLHARLQAAVTAGISNPVVYIDNLAGNQAYSFSALDIPIAFRRTPGVDACSPNAVLVVVRTAGVIYQGGNNGWRSMSMLVPEGSFRGNGGYNVLGTLFANNISLGGNEQFRLDGCYVDNLPGGLLDLTAVSFQELDRTG
jgi:hypothetical protein